MIYLHWRLMHWARPLSKSIKSFYNLYGRRTTIPKPVWDWYIHTAIFKIGNQQRPTVYPKEFCPMWCDNLNGKRTWKGVDTCVRITESLCCTPETITTLLINCACLVTQWCLTLCNPMDCRPLGSSVHAIL